MGHLERVTANKLESIRLLCATVPTERRKNNRVISVALARTLFNWARYSVYPTPPSLIFSVKSNESFLLNLELEG